METESQFVRQRAAVVVIVDGRLALIRRDWEGRRYFLFPGGGVDPGETPEGAAVREAREELGWNVKLTGLVGRGVLGGTQEQLYYSAVVEGGVFGSGDGLEMAFPADGPDGSHTPVLVPMAELAGLDVRPRVLVDRIVAGSLGDGVVEFVE